MRDCLQALEEIIESNQASNIRSLRLLTAPPTSPEGWCQGWAYCPPSSMADVLDVRLTKRTVGKKEFMVWTQGGNFALSEGHVIYRNDCLDVYKLAWGKALETLPLHCLQVISAVPVAPSAIVSREVVEEESLLKTRKDEIKERGNILRVTENEKGWLITERAWREAGSVTFATLEKQNGRLVKTGRHTVTQDEFVRLLITGKMP